MSLLLWRILCIISAVLFIAVVITLFVTNLTKNKYYQNYHEDELLKKERSTNSINSIYLTSGETRKYIKKYVVCRSVYEKYVVCNFAAKYRQIRFYVVQFNRRKKVKSVLEITQKDVTESASRVIALKKSCAYVNVVIASADDEIINQNYVRPIAMYRLRLYAFLKSLAVFFALFVIRHIIAELLGSGLIFGKDTAYQYLNNSLNYIAVGASFLLAGLSYLITVFSFRRRNARALNGGALEYEFV